MGKGCWFVAVTLMTVLAIGSLAWACTGQPEVFAISPQSGPSGIEVTVTGRMTTTGPVQIRWNGNGISEGIEPVEASTGPGGEFSVQVLVPAVSPGVYYITVEADDRSVARTTFEVTTEFVSRTSDKTDHLPRALAGDLWTGLRHSESSFDVPAEAAKGGSVDKNAGRERGAGVVLLMAGAGVLAGLALTGRYTRKSSSG